MANPAEATSEPLAFEGDLSVLEQLGSTMVQFEVAFEVLPGTKAPSQETDLNDFEVGPLELGPE